MDSQTCCSVASAARFSRAASASCRACSVLRLCRNSSRVTRPTVSFLNAASTTYRTNLELIHS